MERRVAIYASGLFRCSVCAPKEMTADEVAAEVESRRPAGTERGWRKSDDPTFATGSPNPCPCNDHPEERLHWLLDC